MPPSPTLRPYARSAPQRAARNARDARRLAAVSGVVIPSKLPVGRQPVQGRWERGSRMVFPCSVCGRRFVQKHQVRVHMAPCVARNGNPRGVRWDDGWRGGVIKVGVVGQDGVGGGDVGDVVVVDDDDDATEDEQTLDHQLEDSVLERYKAEERQLNTHQVPSSPSDASQSVSPFIETFIYDGVQSTPISMGLLQHDVEMSSDGSETATLDSVDLQSVSSASSNLTPYDPDLRMDVLTNKSLISMLKAWQDFVQRVAEGHSVVHLQFQRIMDELGRRGIVDESWTWTVDLERVDMACRRVLDGGPRS